MRLSAATFLSVTVTSLLIAFSSTAQTNSTFPFAGLPPKSAAEAMRVPEGFTVTLFAGEPDVKQPVAFCIDDRGRLWVAENYSYPHRQPEGQGRDRIVVFEDTRGDSRFDKRIVFADDLNLVTAIQTGFGGLWVGAAPHLIFIPIADADLKPAGPRQIVLDGFGYQDTHNTLSTFVWGPDGWLYGGHGIASQSFVGKLGAPEHQRRALNGGVWRYHPTKEKFEVFAEGSTNPWGLDFDEHGQLFITGCVLPHLWHIVQGGRYHRLFGRHENPHTYEDIQTIADHRHWAGDHSKAGREGERTVEGIKDYPEDYEAGGGHAHAGAMIYLGDNWPAQYRGQFFMNNLHGHRLNADVLERRGSGFAGRHGRDFLFTQDKWSLVLNLQYGPDGAVYMIDFYEKNLCHNPDAGLYDRSNGRIYKISYGQPQAKPIDLQKLSDAKLVDLHLHRNEWFVRHARRILQERAAANRLQRGTARKLEELLRKNPDPGRQLRAFWTLHVIGAMTEQALLKHLRHDNEHLRAWAIQFLCEDENPSSAALAEFNRMARGDASPIVRLYLAAALQRIPIETRWEIVSGLCRHAEDGSDQNLPLMIWYGFEPLCVTDPARALEVAQTAKVPKLLQFTTRRIAARDDAEGWQAIVKILRATMPEPADAAGASDSRGREILSGMSAAVKGRRKVPMPAGWDDVERASPVPPTQRFGRKLSHSL